MDIAHEPGRAIGGDIARGEGVEHELDSFISKRHEQRVKTEGERAIEDAWREAERREEARRRRGGRERAPGMAQAPTESLRGPLHRARRVRRETRSNRTERSMKIMAKDPMDILNQRDAEVTKIRGYVDLTEEAKNKRIAEVMEMSNAEYQEAVEANEQEIADRLQRTKKAVFRVPVSATATDAEEAQIHAAFRGAYNEVLSATSGEDPQQAHERLESILQQAERTGDKLLATATYHRAIDLGAQGIVDAYLSSRPAASRAWESYTEAHQEANRANSFEGLLGRGFMARAFSSETAG
jgi:hypothetical protein